MLCASAQAVAPETPCAMSAAKEQILHDRDGNKQATEKQQEQVKENPALAGPPEQHVNLHQLNSYWCVHLISSRIWQGLTSGGRANSRM